jgi:hypothetical protein
MARRSLAPRKKYETIVTGNFLGSFDKRPKKERQGSFISAESLSEMDKRSLMGPRALSVVKNYNDSP